MKNAFKLNESIERKLNSFINKNNKWFVSFWVNIYLEKVYLFYSIDDTIIILNYFRNIKANNHQSRNGSWVEFRGWGSVSESG